MLRFVVIVHWLYEQCLYIHSLFAVVLLVPCRVHNVTSRRLAEQVDPGQTKICGVESGKSHSQLSHFYLFYTW